MLGQTHPPSEKPSPHLQVEAHPSALSREGTSQRSSRLLCIGLGFAVLMLIGVSACALLPVASHVSPKSSRLAPTAAFNPSLPALAAGGIRAAKRLHGQNVASPQMAFGIGEGGKSAVRTVQEKVRIEVEQGEPIEKALRRFKKATNIAGHLKILRNRKQFETNAEKKIRKRKESLQRQARDRRSARSREARGVR